MATCNDTGKKYSFKQLEELWIKAGGNPSLATTMAAIGYAESSGGLKPYGDCGLGAPGPTSFGIWQIHTPAHPQYNEQQLVSDPLYNAKAAVAVSGNSAGGLGAWTTYKTGAYKSYLGYKSLEGNKGFQESAKENVEGGIGAVVPGLPNVLSWGEDFAKILSFLGSSAGWLRVGKVVIGGSLLLISVVELARIGSGSGGSLPNTAKKVGEIAAGGGIAGSVAALADKGPPAPPEETKKPDALAAASVAEHNAIVEEEVEKEKYNAENPSRQDAMGNFIAGG